jgi:hypothetical protein
VFFAEEAESPSVTQYAEKEPKETEPSQSENIVRTGDPVDINRYVLLLLLSMALAASVWRMRMGGKEK